MGKSIAVQEYEAWFEAASSSKAKVSLIARSAFSAIWERRRYVTAALVRTRLAVDRLLNRRRSARRKSRSNAAIYLDMTWTFEQCQRGGPLGGIGKVAQNLARCAGEIDLVYPIVFIDGQPWTIVGQEPHQNVQIRPGDILLIIDCYWHSFRFYPMSIARLKKSGVFVCICIHDLIPLVYPSLVSLPLYVSLNAYTKIACIYSDAILSVSRASAEEISNFLKSKGFLPDQAVVHSFFLGFEPSVCEPAPVPADLAQLLNKTTFISVGSLMPHKCQVIALRAMRTLWSSGCNINYIIFSGSSGSLPIETEIINDANLGKRLFWVRDAPDNIIEYAYRHALALIQPSLAEGFGLPMIEGRHYAIPIIASDLAVFREIAGNAAYYFPPCDVASLSSVIRLVADGGRSDRQVEMSNTTSITTWSDSLTILVRKLREAVEVGQASKAEFDLPTV